MTQLGGTEGLNHKDYGGLSGLGVEGCYEDAPWSWETLDQRPAPPRANVPQDMPSPLVASQMSFFSISRYRGLSGKQCSSMSWREAGMTTTERKRGQNRS